MGERKYYLGIDGGTDSVGYAVTDTEYTLLKHNGEPMWGVQLFDAASPCADRRGFRTARRRLDRRQQRIHLLRDLLADEIAKVDPDFYIRQDKSALYTEDSGEPYSLFHDADYTDKQYHDQYPTIHHLIWDLMTSETPHDVRLIYLACAWLLAHRGHFLSDISMDNLEAARDFSIVYSDMVETLLRRTDGSVSLPWELVDTDLLGNILKQKKGITAKHKAIAGLLFDGKIPKDSESFSLNFDVMFKLLCGGKASAADLFQSEEYAEVESFSLDSDDEKIAAIMNQLGDDAEVIQKLKTVFDWSQLAAALEGSSCISESKVKVYDQHRTDLKFLKYIIRKYVPEQYNAVFRDSVKNNYVSYSYHTDHPDVKKTNKEDFCKYLNGIVKTIAPDEEDAAGFADMTARLETRTFLPKQKDSDNRVIPQQLYQYELSRILANAERYLPSLSEKDQDGLSISEKILSIFTFRVPYYIGPLNGSSPYAWIHRKADGKIYPWNFASLVDEDASEQEFIRRMTNRCTYLPDADVLPKESLLYHRFMVLNEINNIRIDDQPLTVEQKQMIYEGLFLRRRKVSRRALTDFLVSRNIMNREQQITGIDEQIKSDLKPYHDFARLLSGTLTEEQVEEIILRRTYTDEKPRLIRWLQMHYPTLSAADVKYIAGLNYKDFGRLSREFLAELEGESTETGEVMTVISALWNTNDNLMQILSDRYTFAEKVDEIQREYYDAHPMKLAERLDEMVLPNAVKRPVIRTLDIIRDVVKANGCAPERIFIEMTRGGTPEQKNKRTQSRREQILQLYSQCREEDVRLLTEQLNSLGADGDMRLRGDKLFLYFMQFGKCAYSGEQIDLGSLADKTYDIEHIYPQSYVKDDSILNNKVLVKSELNGQKSDTYPVPAKIRSRMAGIWAHWHTVGTINDEKYKRLTRSIGFTEEEKTGFINRQLTETSQSTKAVAKLLKEYYPDTEVVYVKARLTSEFRQEFDLLKSRTFNDLHHAKDAYLNIVTGNVYYERFTRRWFDTTQKYSVNTHAVFGKEPKYSDGEKYWDGSRSLDKVRSVVQKNNAHCTKYAYCRHGGFFDQMPVGKAEGLISRKAGLVTEKYGGYNKATVTFFILTKYRCGKKTETMMMPVELLHQDEMLSGETAEYYAKQRIGAIVGKPVDTVTFPLGLRPIKINTILSMDGFRVTLAGGAGGGKCIIVAPFMMFSASHETETYIKRLEEFSKKCSENQNYVYSAQYDKVTPEENLALYDLYCDKIKNSIYKKRQNAPTDVFEKGRGTFLKLDVKSQAVALLNMHTVFGRVSGGCDLTAIGGTAHSASTVNFSSSLSNWKKYYSDVRIIDTSASGIWEKQSVNLLDLL